MTRLRRGRKIINESKIWSARAISLTNLILDELGTTFITPFDREDIHDLASGMDDVIDGINRLCQAYHYL